LAKKIAIWHFFKYLGRVFKLLLEIFGAKFLKVHFCVVENIFNKNLSNRNRANLKKNLSSPY